MMIFSRIAYLLLIAVCSAGCSGGGSDVAVDPPPPLPGQPQVTVEGETKYLVFSWAAVPRAEHYRLMENADGHSGFTQVGSNIPAGISRVVRDIAVHQFDWANASYIVEACNPGGCTASPETGALDAMLDTIGYFKASNADPSDWFGGSLALSGDGNTLAVGARWEDSSATGVNGDQADNSASDKGAVYLFRFDGTSWVQQAYIKASNTGVSSNFGSSVALSFDGNTLAVGADRESSGAVGIDGDQADFSASRSGAVYLYRFDGSVWFQEAYVKASNTDVDDLFGGSVALSADGNTLASGAFWEDSAATGINGDDSDNSLSSSGAAYVFRFDGSSWSQQAYVKASNAGFSDQFGISLSLSADGDTLAVGARFEASQATGVNGDQNDDVSLKNFGATYLFRYDGSDWRQQAYIKASNTGQSDRFGTSTALSADGNTLAVGAVSEDSNATGIDGDQGDGEGGNGSGAVYLYRFDGADWYQQAYIKASNTGAADTFGNVALSADGNMLAVGARWEDSISSGINGDEFNDHPVGGAGAVYLYEFDGSSWRQSAYVKATNPGSGFRSAGCELEPRPWLCEVAGDTFGSAVALSADGNTLAVGAPFEDSSATGINGDQADNSAEDAGAVYVY